MRLADLPHGAEFTDALGRRWRRDVPCAPPAASGFWCVRTDLPRGQGARPDVARDRFSGDAPVTAVPIVDDEWP